MEEFDKQYSGMQGEMGANGGMYDDMYYYDG